AKELAGKDAVFKVTCKEVLAFVDRPIDDVLAKSTGFETLDAMRKQVAERIGQDYQQLSRNMIKRKLLDRLSEVAKFEVPAGLVEAEFNEIWRQYEAARQRAGAEAPQPSEEEIEKSKVEYRAIAER